MVNFQFNSTSLVGILLMVAGAGLYLLRSVRPELARDHDIFFSAIGLVCGLIFVFQAWRFDPIMQFGQILLAVTAGFFGFDSIRMRGIATQQAKRNTKVVEDDRPVSSTYYTEAELEDDFEPMDDRYNPRQLRGSVDRSRGRRNALDDGDSRPRSSARNRDNRLGSGSSRRSRRSSGASEARIVQSQADLWGTDNRDDWERPAKSRDDWGVEGSNSRGAGSSSEEGGRKRRRPKSNNPTSSYETSSETSTRPRRNRPRPSPETDVTSNREEETQPSDYVNYQPIEPKEDERDDYSEY
ncbi:Ycf66 family protein [Merismopedia glauca]|uniref:Ycf66 family protein n=1 Tax=Merismopedia glauca CCAP 1448/3 TaxID=1296344 RepID=A0A2T1C2C3_9CYAN|nr:Ycf66 family protein [Merismopedia glauca]PSB02420.1 hypothetical protein C7B64_13340 [Merismopedia glauca CCAP 1448/3]